MAALPARSGIGVPEDQALCGLAAADPVFAIDGAGWIHDSPSCDRSDRQILVPQLSVLQHLLGGAAEYDGAVVENDSPIG